VKLRLVRNTALALDCLMAIVSIAVYFEWVEQVAGIAPNRHYHADPCAFIEIDSVHVPAENTNLFA